MKQVRSTVGSTKFLLHADAPEAEITEITDARKTVQTGLAEQAGEAYDDIKEVIGAITRDFSASLQTKSISGPNLTEIEFSMELSVKTGLWVVGTEGKTGFKVKLAWSK